MKKSNVKGVQHEKQAIRKKGNLVKKQHEKMQ